MQKTQKELAFLREMHIADKWTQRFADLIDKHLKFNDEENLLYLNAGTGNHCFALKDRVGEKTAFFAQCENDDLLSISRDKAIAVGADIDFSMVRFEDDSFDLVLTDATLERSSEAGKLLGESVRIVRENGRVAVMMVSAGSFGEIFSLLWEVLFNEDLGQHGAAAESLIARLPTISKVEELAENAGLKNINIHSASEIFEYEWLESLNDEEKERVNQKLAELIDSEDGSLTFRFTVKATLLIGTKSARQ